MLEHSFTQFFLSQSLPPRHWPRLYVCMRNSIRFPAFLRFLGPLLLRPNKKTMISSFLFLSSFPIPLVVFPSFAHLSFFLIQIGHCALKRSVFPRSKQAALFPAILHPDLLCSKSPFNCNPPILAKRACFLQKVSFFLQFRNVWLHFPKTISRLKGSGQFLAELAKISRFCALSPT